MSTSLFSICYNGPKSYYNMDIWFALLLKRRRKYITSGISFMRTWFDTCFSCIWKGNLSSRLMFDGVLDMEVCERFHANSDYHAKLLTNIYSFRVTPTVSDALAWWVYLLIMVYIAVSIFICSSQNGYDVAKKKDNSTLAALLACSVALLYMLYNQKWTVTSIQNKIWNVSLFIWYIWHH